MAALGAEGRLGRTCKGLWDYTDLCKRQALCLFRFICLWIWDTAAVHLSGVAGEKLTKRKRERALLGVTYPLGGKEQKSWSKAV